MTYFPQHSSLRLTALPSGGRASGNEAARRDVLWGRPIFKAPALPNPRHVFDPLPFTAARVTHPARRVR
jgi:hypothetical protein